MPETTTPNYVVPVERRVPTEDVVIGSRVFVPEWWHGRIIGWIHGSVFLINTPTPTPGVAPGEYDTSYIVRLDNGREQGYFAYSLGDPTVVSAAVLAALKVNAERPHFTERYVGFNDCPFTRYDAGDPDDVQEACTCGKAEAEAALAAINPNIN